MMCAEKISPHNIPTGVPFNRRRCIRIRLEKSSNRYFWVSGSAKFKCPAHKTWRSFHASCVIDLKAQDICHNYIQGCKHCHYKAKPVFVDASLQKMVKYAINKYLHRVGLKKKRPMARKFRARRLMNKIPHDMGRCSRCQELRKNCSRI